MKNRVGSDAALSNVSRRARAASLFSITLQVSSHSSSAYIYSGACRAESEIGELDVRMRIHGIKERSLAHLVAVLRFLTARQEGFVVRYRRLWKSN